MEPIDPTVREWLEEKNQQAREERVEEILSDPPRWSSLAVEEWRSASLLNIQLSNSAIPTVKYVAKHTHAR